MKWILNKIIDSAHSAHVTHRHGGGFGYCHHLFCRIAAFIHTSSLSPYPDTCQLCGKTWYPNFHQRGYQWTCDSCRHIGECPECNSDEVYLDWEIAEDHEGKMTEPYWRVECFGCEIRTPFYEFPQSAKTAWDRRYFLRENKEVTNA